MNDFTQHAPEARQALLDRVADQMARTGSDPDTVRLLMERIAPWYLFPGSQLRPRVVGLWGMTGIGKTHLVRAVVTALGLEDRTVWCDGGHLALHGVNGQLDGLYQHYNGQPFVLVVDEFHLARSRRGAEEEDRGGMRVIWELLDGGQVNVFRRQTGAEVLLDLRDALHMAIPRGLCIRNGRVTAGVEVLRELSSTDHWKNEGGTGDPWFFPRDFWEWLREIMARPVLGQTAFMRKLEGLHTENILAFVDELLRECMLPRPFDVSQALVLVLGNLDALYTLGEEPLPELDPDVLVARHARIELPQIMGSLRELFRIEQVARLGTDQFAMAPFSRQRYLDAARSRTATLTERMRQQDGVEVLVDPALVEHIVQGNTVAVLGFRPVITALDRLLPALVHAGRSQALRHGVQPRSIGLRVEQGAVVIAVQYDHGTLAHRTPLPAGAFPSTGPVLRAHAVHEAGHAVAGIALLGLRPLQVCARTINTDIGGFVVFDMPPNDPPLTRDQVVPHMAVDLAGWVAERMVLGEGGLTAGSGGDIEKATRMAQQLLRAQGFGDLPLLHARFASAPEPGTHHRCELPDRMAEAWVREAVALAEAALRREQALFTALVDQLMVHGSLGPDELQLLMQRHSDQHTEGSVDGLRLAG